MTAAVGVAKRSLGGYDILYELKTGGMGEVLLARKLGTGGFEKLVALKTIRSDLRDVDQLRTMFLDEARLLGRLNHPAIAAVHDFGEDGETLYLAMEYVAGVRFSELVRRDPPAVVCARAMAQACRGLHAAHELADLAGQSLNVVHRDVSPENLMLTFDGRVKVLDFGIALMRGRQAPVTEFGTIKGKPPYLAPEQIKNEPVDRRTDIFAAAVVLHEMITGEQVFQGDSVYAVARSIEHHDVPPPSAIVGDLPEGLDDAVLRGLQRDPQRRYQTAQEMAEALERVCNYAGGASLEAYAKGELKKAGDDHRVWLHELVTGTHTLEVTRGRPSGVMTAQAQGMMEAEFDLPEGALANLPHSRKPPPAPPDDSFDDETGHRTAMRHKRSRTWAIIALIAGAAVMVTAIILATSSSSGREQPQRAALVFDAGPADAGGPVDGETEAATTRDAGVVDATPPRPRDARGETGGRADARRPKPPTRRIDAAVPRPPPPKIDAAPPKVAKFGTITIAATPFANVHIDGKFVAATPLLKHRLPVGAYEIKLIDPANGNVRLKQRVVIREGPNPSVIAR